MPRSALALALVATLVLALTTLLARAAPVSLYPRTIPAKGKLCTPSDPHYSGQAYGIAKCERSVSSSEKDQVAAHYGLLASEYSSVEFDHMIPLGIGGSNDYTNLWPQRGPTGQSEAGAKDKVENDAYNKLSAGTITQKQAVQMICDWMNNQYGTSYKPSNWGL
ncbi:hypothetical protein DFJ73DRAFT_962394 [Zopfochytrium polystomum]|nr:hypothetical protein DFJ73DRAFT_962394 [Zopfochytrium polystomum]